jgi:hypothetical protein
VTDTGATHVALLPGTGVGADEVAALAPEGVVVEVLDAADEVRSVVGSLALVGAGPTSQGCAAARSALARLDVHALEVASSGLVRDALDALVGVPRAVPAESLTVLLQDASDAALVDDLVDHLAAHHPGVEATVVGPTGRGPALVLGLD